MSGITIGKRWEENSYYVGRPSPLGNPFVMKGESDRDEVCEKYDQWLRTQISQGNQKIISELQQIDRMSANGIVLGCYCHPKRCHAESIKAVIEEGLV